MLASSDLLMYLPCNWDAPFRHRAHFLAGALARQLEGKSKVLCVERPSYIVTAPFAHARNARSWIRGSKGIRKVSENLFVLTPLALFHDQLLSRVPALGNVSRKLFCATVKDALRQAGVRLPMVNWVFHPHQVGYVGMVPASISVYDCYDEHSALPDIPFFRTKRDTDEKEAKLLRKVDLVFVVSQLLLQRKQGAHPRVHLVPNGTDCWKGLYTGGDEHVIPLDMKPIPRPVVGFIGNITHRVDFELISRTAMAHPEWSFVMVGGLHGATNRFLKSPAYQRATRAPNIHLLGAKPYKDLPGYLNAFDVCTIPYASRDEYNANCDPLKLYEYMATGKPIVSTDLPAVRPFAKSVIIAADYAAFESAVASSLQERDEGLRRERIKLARENSWDQRASTILSIIGSL